MLKRWIKSAIALAGMFAAGPVFAWGPVTQEAVVRAATHVLSNDGRVPIVKLSQYATEGASISQDELMNRHPSFSVDPVGAIQREMSLLQAVRSDRIDPYYAYRMGVLGKMVTQAVAPLADAPPNIKSAYYTDVDGAIQGARLQNSQRKLVDPRPYFNSVIRDARSNDQTIILEYQAGDGFQGLARNAVPGDASRAVAVVADVWHTIFASQVDYANVEPAKMRDFMLGSLDYYLKKQRLAEAEDTYRRTASLGLLNPDTRKEVADRFFDAGYEERAVEEYRVVLAEQPGRRDATDRIAAHYTRVGDEWMQRNNLENARDAYAEAAAADRLRGDAQRKLFEVEKEIEDRTTRLARAREGIEQSRRLQTDAEISAARRNYAQAITQLEQARSLLAAVPEEFIAESQIAQANLLSVEAQMGQVRAGLIDNAQSLSGSASGISMQHAANAYPSRSREGLESLMQRIFEERMGEMNDRLTSQPIGRR